MPEYNMSDREQVDMIKKWWKDYGRAIAIAVGIGLVVGFGWKYWHQHQVRQSEEASLAYQNMSSLAFQKKIKQARQLSQRLIETYPNSPYATFAALWSAKEAVAEHNLPSALKSCEWVLKYSHVDSLKQIARIRAARILLAQKKPKVAMTLIDTVDDKAFMPLIQSVKGDIYAAKGNMKAARKAYDAAKVGMSSSINATDPLLSMKLAQP